MTEWATTLEPKTEQEDMSLSNKRGRTGSRNEKARDEDRKSRRDTIIAMAQWVLEVVLEQVGVEHDCGLSEACPAWMCESMIKMRKIEERIEELNIEIANLKLEDDKEKDDPEEDPEEPAISTQAGGCSNLPVPEHNNLQRISPIKMLIDKFKNWKADPPKHPEGWNTVKIKTSSVPRLINKMNIQTIGGGELPECQPGNVKPQTRNTIQHTGKVPYQAWTWKRTLLLLVEI